MERTVEAGKHEQSSGPSGRAKNVTPLADPLSSVLELQQQVGNQAVQETLRSGYIQAKLAIGNPDVPEEREADQVAQAIVRSPGGLALGGECQPALAGAIHRRASVPSAPTDAPEIVNDVLRSPGRPLDSADRAFFEPRFGHDFSQVRVHTGREADASAQSIQAHAYTAGSDIVFARGQYAPDTASGRTLLAHELTHVVQQDGMAKKPSDIVRSRARRSIQRQTNPSAQPPDPLEVQDTPRDEATWRARVDKAVRSMFALSGPGLTASNVRFLDQKAFGQQFTGSDLEEKLFTIFLDYYDYGEPGLILTTNHEPIKLLGPTSSAIESLHKFVKDGIQKGTFHGQTREVDVEATRNDPHGPIHFLPGIDRTPQQLISEFIGGVTDISGPRSTRSIKINVGGGTFQAATLFHEACHFYSSQAFRNMVNLRTDGEEFLGGARIGQILTEGFAEYFSREVMASNAATFGPPGNSYQEEVEQVHRILATLGERTVRAAFFGGDAAAIRRVSVAVDEYKNTSEDLLVPGFVIDVRIQQSSAANPAGSIRRSAIGTATPNVVPGIVHDALRSSGEPLGPSTRAFFERRFGVDFSDVRVHSDARAAQAAEALAANAYTTGRDIYFGARKYAPVSEEGQHLLAHELTHVVQQRVDAPPLGESRNHGELVLGDDHDPLEAEADRTADDVMRRRGASRASTAAAASEPTMQRDIATPETLPAPAKTFLTPSIADPGRAATRGSVGSGSIVRRRKNVAPPEADAKSRLSRNVRRLQSDALPAFQRGLDTVDRAAVEEAGSLVLLLWSTVTGAHYELRPPDGTDLPEFVEIRRAVLAGVTIQKFRGEDVATHAQTIEHVGDVGQYIAIQTREAAGTVKDAAALVLLLGKQRLEYEDEEAAVRIFRDHPNPWQVGYLRVVVSGAGLASLLETFTFENHRDLETVFASQKFTLERGAIGPADRVGVVEPIPAERRVRVLRPYGGEELAMELYGSPSFYQSLLLPYNRGVLADLRPESLIRAGTELAVEPELLWGRYKLVFMVVELSKQQIDRPYIKANIAGAAIAGTKVSYTVRWPVPPPPENAWRLNTGELLWQPTTSMWEYTNLEWLIENDPAKGGGEEFLSSGAVRMETLTTEGSTVERSWPETGTYTVRAHLEFGTLGQKIDLRYTQPVVTEREKVEADAATVVDPRALHLQTAETYEEFQQIAAKLGVTEDELAAKPQLAGPLGLGTAYYPEFLLRDLKKALADTADEKKRQKIGWQIESLEDAIRKTKSWGMRPIRGLYVSSEGERTISAPLAVYIGRDPDAPRALPYPLKLWDFTLEGTGRDYTDGQGESTPSLSLHALLKSFAYQAPYPKGTLRFWIDGSVLPPDFVGDYLIEREVIDLHTHGGPWYYKAAAGVFTVALVGVGSVILGPEVALTAFAIYGAVTGIVDIIQRLEAGTFEFDLQTGMDLLAIAGGLAAGISPIISVVRGVGEVAWLGSVARTTGVLQLGVMVGTDFDRIVKAVRSGDNDEILAAVVGAVSDGALVAVTHMAGKAAEAEARARATVDPVFEGVQGGFLPEPVETGSAPSTAAGIGRGGPPGPPPGQEPPAAPHEGSPRAVHEGWARNLTETGLAPRPGPGAPAGPPVTGGTYKSVSGELSFPTPEAAFAAYDEALARAGGREVGIFRNVEAKTGEYVVRVGDEHTVSPPQGKWESVLHRHPNPENVLTRRMPAPQDVHNTLLSSFRSGRPVTEFIDYALPDGRRGLVSYTVEPVRGRVTIKYERADGTGVERTFDSVEAYASHYSERTTYVDPKSPEYQWMMRDLEDFYEQREPSGFATAAGIARPGAAPKSEAASKPEGVIERPTGKGAPTPAEPRVRTRVELDRATQAMAQRIETLKQHHDAAKMADELDVIRKELGEGREADASARITALEKRIGRAQLSLSSGMFERLYGETTEVLGSRVIEYTPVADSPPIDLGPETPLLTDATGQKLLAHVRRAVAEFDASMFTEAERLALKDAERSGGRSRRSSLYDAFRGSHIDRLAKKAVLEDQTLSGHVQVTLNLEYGADFYDSETGIWYDITTNRAWRAHKQKYGPEVPGRAIVPGFRLPTEPDL